MASRHAETSGERVRLDSVDQRVSRALSDRRSLLEDTRQIVHPHQGCSARSAGSSSRSRVMAGVSSTAVRWVMMAPALRDQRSAGAPTPAAATVPTMPRHRVEVGAVRTRRSPRRASLRVIPPLLSDRQPQGEAVEPAAPDRGADHVDRRPTRPAADRAEIPPMSSGIAASARGTAIGSPHDPGGGAALR